MKRKGSFNNRKNYIVRLSLTLWLSLGIIVLSPFYLLALPFIIAWEKAGEMIGKKQEYNRETYQSTWGDFSMYLNKWKGIEE